MNDFIKANPGLREPIAAEQWIAGKFGTWISENIGNDFTITDANSNGFLVEFTYEDDADDFLRKLGGYQVVA